MTDDNGETPLHTACNTDHLDIVKYLVQLAHCDVGKSGLSAIMRRGASSHKYKYMI